ncbi:MAG: hypothetical protein L0H53_03215 [Candidatus Nitrosocosmicus sp.]|nr:hypothetical protein [Candidatus Nitrosocosmicus sp.]
MDEFTNLLLEFKNNIDANMPFFQKAVIQNPTLAYYKLNELSKFVGSRYGLVMEIHFPDRTKIGDIKHYGTENMSFIFDKFRKTFPIGRDLIKLQATKGLSRNVQIIDAYMYEGKEGLKINFKDSESNNSRIDLLPGSFHLWTKIDEDIEKFCNWLLSNVYQQRIKKD